MAQEKKKAAPRKPKAAKLEVVEQITHATAPDDTTPPADLLANTLQPVLYAVTQDGVQPPEEAQGGAGIDNKATEAEAATENEVDAPDGAQPTTANGAGAPNNESDNSEKNTPESVDGLEVARVLKVTKPLMQGEDVKALQAALVANNYHCGVEGIDGIYAKNTAYAVRCFQAANGLIVDGRAGRFTITALGGKWTGEKIKLQILET